MTAGQKRSMEGRVVQKVDCRPVVSNNYMKLKRTQMIEAAKPKRLTKQLSAAVTTTFKPVSMHKEEVICISVVHLLSSHLLSFCKPLNRMPLSLSDWPVKNDNRLDMKIIFKPLSSISFRLY